MRYSKFIKLTAQAAYEACMHSVPGAIGWEKETPEIKEGWYKAAHLWSEAEAAANVTLSKGKPRANQRS